MINPDLGEKEMCKGHKKACVMKTVAKVGENKGRAFWSCPMPRYNLKICLNFFAVNF